MGSVDAPHGKNGWLVGSFLPTDDPFNSQALEVAWKKMGSSDKDPVHIHTSSTEVVIVVSGRIDYLAENDTGDLEMLSVLERHFILVKQGIKCGVKQVWEGTEAIVLRAPSVPGDKVVVEV